MVLRGVRGADAIAGYGAAPWFPAGRADLAAGGPRSPLRSGRSSLAPGSGRRMRHRPSAEWLPWKTRLALWWQLWRAYRAELSSVQRGLWGTLQAAVAARVSVRRIQVVDSAHLLLEFADQTTVGLYLGSTPRHQPAVFDWLAHQAERGRLWLMSARQGDMGGGLRLRFASRDRAVEVRARSLVAMPAWAVPPPT
jgi:hypothetical protein